MADNKNQEGFDFFKLRAVDFVNLGFILYMFTFYLIYMDNMYFNITYTRALVFWKGVGIYAVCVILAYAYDCFGIGRSKRWYLKERFLIKDDTLLSMPEFWLGGFVLANTVAFINAPDKHTAWTGESGRFFGLMMILIIAVMFILVSRRCCVTILHFIAVLATSILAVVMAYLQHFGGDPFLLRERILEKQQELFISLFGNINTYGSFLAMAIPGIVAGLIFAKKYYVRLVAGAGLFIVSLGVIPAKSDNVYLGTGVAMILLMFLSIYYRHIVRFMVSCVIMLASFLFMAYRNAVGKGSQKHINGLAEVIENPKIMLLLFIVAVIAAVLVFLLDNKVKKSITDKIAKKIILFMLISMVVVGIIFFIIGRNAGLSIFVSNDKWGTFRGYIWRRSVSLYRMANPWHKLFGYGNETIKALMMGNFKEEMIKITARTYDNSHNELLQYLVTTGLVGMVSYIGLFISSVRYMVKNADNDATVIALAAASTGYWVQGTVYLNQPITTPLFFVLLAAGIGYIRYRKQEGRSEFPKKVAEKPTEKVTEKVTEKKKASEKSTEK